MLKYKKIIIPLVLLAVLLTASACGKKQASSIASPTTGDDNTPVTIAKAAIGDINAVASVTGKLAARQEVNIVPKAPGKVAEVPFDVGSIVKKGQVILRLDAKDMAASVKQAQAGYAVATANYYKTKVGARSEQRDQTLASLAQANANYQKALDDLYRNQDLYNQGAISSQALEGFKVGLTTVKAAYSSAKDAWTMMQKGETAETFKILQAQMDQARAQMELAQANFDNSVITSPIAGIIGARNIDPGEIATSASPALTIIDIDTVQVEANITEEQVNKLYVGEEVQIHVNAADSKEFTGKIKTIAPMANSQNKMYPIKVVIPNANHTLKPGMFAEVALPVEKKQNVLLVPREAITEVSGDKGVYIVDSQGKAEFKKADVGVSDGTKIEILSGIDSGATVITSGQLNLQNGTKVKAEGKI